MKTFADWLEFLELTLGTKDAVAGSFLDGLDDLPVDEALPLLETYERSLDSVLGMDSAFKLAERFPWLPVVEDIAGTNERDIKTEDGQGSSTGSCTSRMCFGERAGSTFRWGIRHGCGRSGLRARSWPSAIHGSCWPSTRRPRSGRRRSPACWRMKRR
ncbi:hypothetical protein NKH18_38400 [Streptomyces sp. M10(2022)]